MSQIVLPLSLRRELEQIRIVVGNANQSVVDALRDPSPWPFRTAIMLGPPRSGKTLLGRWFAAQGKGEVIEGADAMDETELFHRWNRAQEQDRPLLLIADSKSWEVDLPDLRSRLGAALQLEIGSPDDDMIAGLIESHAEQRGLALGEGALNYLVPRTSRSFEAIERLVAEIDRLSLERKVPATQAIWRSALEAVSGPEQARLL